MGWIDRLPSLDTRQKRHWHPLWWTPKWSILGWHNARCCLINGQSAMKQTTVNARDCIALISTSSALSSSKGSMYSTVLRASFFQRNVRYLPSLFHLLEHETWTTCRWLSTSCVPILLSSSRVSLPAQQSCYATGQIGFDQIMLVSGVLSSCATSALKLSKLLPCDFLAIKDTIKWRAKACSSLGKFGVSRRWS